KTVQDRKFDAVRYAWGGGIEDDPFQIWHSSQKEGGGSNFVGFENKRADEIIEIAREEFDALKRWEMYREFHNILHDEQPYAFMFAFEELFFYNKKFRNVKIYGVHPGYSLSEWYIFPNRGLRIEKTPNSKLTGRGSR
ncbi:hypothetical protein KA005_07045, partial [bacterium]|nr:hypothetical protein [bacterium]